MRELFYKRVCHTHTCVNTVRTLPLNKSKVQGLENDTFDVGASSDPAKFSKSLKNIKNYIQKTHKDPDDMVKNIQKMKKVILSYPERPKKTDKDCCDSNGDPDSDALDTAVIAWKEDCKSMKSRMDKYKGNESNAWALIYDQCSPELKNKLKGTEEMTEQRILMTWKNY
jgi:hypothetical protein